MSNSVAKNDELIRDEFSSFLNDTANEVFEEQEKKNHKEKETLRKYYVYALCEIDENNKRLIPFYIGKGTGDRVWNHADETADEIKEIEEEAKKYGYSDEYKQNLLNTVSEKHKKITELGKDKISYIIIKSGLTEYESFMCESALINLLTLKQNDLSYSGNDLTNKVNGHSNYFEKAAGINTCALSVNDYFERYCKKPIIVNEMTEEQRRVFANKKIRLQNINMTFVECTNLKVFPTPEEQKEAIQKAVCGFWQPSNMDRMDYVFAMYQGRIKGVYKVIKEKYATSFHKILEIAREDYPRFDQLETRRRDYEIASKIIEELKLDINHPYFGLDQEHIYEKLSEQTRTYLKNVHYSGGKIAFEPPKKDEDEIEHYNNLLKNWSKRQYFVLKEITDEDIKNGIPDFNQFLNCSIKERRKLGEAPVNIFSGLQGNCIYLPK